MPNKIKSEDLPRFVRRCWEAARKATQENRAAEIERLKFYSGDQWRETEKRKREQNQRPFIVVNKCKPAVDQVEGDIRLNPPGPQCHPVGDGADADTADIIEGLIREVEYRSGAKTAYSTAGKYVAASGCAYIELATEYVSDRDSAQQLVIQSIEDPAMVFFDPAARKANRQDASWAGKLKVYSEIEYISTFGKNRRILKSRATQQAMGWIQEQFGFSGDMAQVNEWTGSGKGPYYVCEFYMVEVDPVKLTTYSDNIARFEDEPVPKGVKPKEGDEYTRKVPRRKITKHIVDALEELEEPTEWLGSLIPIFPVLGPEIYIDGKLHRLSLISEAIDSQRALNFVATTAVEIGGLMPKSPWIGYEGQFANEKWQKANQEVYAYLEIHPTFATDENGQNTLLPPPQRNQWEAPIQWLLALGTFFSDCIKAVTSIYDPSLGRGKSGQSGVAIQQLRAESNVGNYSYSDNLHRAIEVMYGEMCLIFPKILDGPRVTTIVKPDSQHEVVEINREFPGGIDPATGKKGKARNISLGRYSVRVTAGPSFDTREQESIPILTDFFGKNPQALAIPGVAAKVIRILGQGNPKIESIADLMTPPTGAEEETTPQQLGQQLQQVQQQNQMLMQAMQQMQQALAEKQPEIEAKKWVAALNALAGIREAEIRAGVDRAKLNAHSLEHLTGLAHDTALTQAQEANEAELTQASQEHESGMQVADQLQATQSQESEYEHAAEMQAAKPAPQDKGAEK